MEEQEQQEIDQEINQEEKNGQQNEETDSQTPPQEQEGDSPAMENAVPLEQQLQEKLKEAEDRTLRVRADFDNYRKRTAKEFAEIRERTKISMVNEFLPVYDLFKMAYEHAGQTPDFQVLKQGMDMILAEFTKTLDNLGVKEIPAVGRPFDPHLHEAIKTEPSDTVPEGTVISQWKAGYRIGDQLVRPTMAVVSAGKQQES
jgi:molecular chaperone GrpE